MSKEKTCAFQVSIREGIRLKKNFKCGLVTKNLMGSSSLHEPCLQDICPMYQTWQQMKTSGDE